MKKKTEMLHKDKSLNDKLKKKKDKVKRKMFIYGTKEKERLTDLV